MREPVDDLPEQPLRSWHDFYLVKLTSIALYLLCEAPMQLQGKTALVTGGGTGIGWATAKALAAEGCRVAIAGRRVDVLRQAAESVQSEHPILYHEVDVADRASVNALFAWAEKELPPLDILVQAAGVNIKTRMMADMQPEQWDQVMAINATGVYNCLYAALPSMRARRDGLVVIISSISGLRAAPLGGVAYNASKFAATALGISVGGEEAKNGIRITSIFPGEVETPILEHRPQPVSAERRATMLQPEDVAAMVVSVAQLPPRAHVPEIIIKPLVQDFV
jgi:NAD(P)-dependent dehydrogenase (short-subunit alcohol dehydrogenase family)